MFTYTGVTVRWPVKSMQRTHLWQRVQGSWGNNRSRREHFSAKTLAAPMEFPYKGLGITESCKPWTFNPPASFIPLQPDQLAPLWFLPLLAFKSCATPRATKFTSVDVEGPKTAKPPNVGDVWLY